MDKCHGPETSSRLVTRSAQVAHNFEVAGFSLLEGFGVHKFVSSRTFSAGGHDWNIRVYPDGNNDNEEDKGVYVSVFLHFLGGAEGVKTAQARYTFDLLEKDDRVSPVRPTTPATVISYAFAFDPAPRQTYGLPKFLEKSKLKQLLRLNGDRFTIRCVLTVIGEPQFEDIATVVVPPSNMHQHFERMYKDGKGKDVTFDVDGRLFHAHRYVLAARSPVFDAELVGSMKETKDAEEPIKVDGMEACMFEELLHFMYTDRMSDKFDGPDRDLAMQHLLVAADRYGVDRLRDMCEDKLCHGIDEQTVATTLALADQHSCVGLKDACLRFIASGDAALGAVMETDGFKHLAASCPFVMVEILDKIAKSKSQ